jgi:hypothetical protein
MGKFGKNRLPKFMKSETEVTESTPIVTDERMEKISQPEIVSMANHGDDHAMIIIRTEEGEELELRFDFDGDGMLTAHHGDHEYSIPVEVDYVESDDDDFEDAPEGDDRFNEAKASCKKQAKPDFLDADKDGDKKESFKSAAKSAKAAGTFESFVINECWNPMEEGYNPAMSEEAKRAIKALCEDLLINEAQMCDEDYDQMHTYENYLNECGSYMTECMMEAAAALKVD